MRKQPTKARLLSNKEAEEELARKAREDEDAYAVSLRRQESLFSARPKPWIQMNQDERNVLIAAFEERVYEVYGCFPKANWMN